MKTQMVFKEGRHGRVAPSVEKYFNWDYWSKDLNPGKFPDVGISQDMGFALCAQFGEGVVGGIDCGLTKCCHSSDFLMVLPLSPTVRSLRFFTMYHCKCFPYLLARAQFVFIITLFLEGRSLGLLLYRANFVIYGAVYVCRRKYNEKLV